MCIRDRIFPRLSIKKTYFWVFEWMFHLTRMNCWTPNFQGWSNASYRTTFVSKFVLYSNFHQVWCYFFSMVLFFWGYLIATKQNKIWMQSQKMTLSDKKLNSLHNYWEMKANEYNSIIYNINKRYFAVDVLKKSMEFINAHVKMI